MGLSEKIHSAIYSSVVGDALGVPVQFATREELNLCAVKNMLGYGRYDQPEGTWSDDTSMILCTIESLCRGFDLEDMGLAFCRWLFDGYWTPSGYVFDAGLTTFMALDNIRTEGKSARISGCKTEDDNGNGSLMRILPAALYFHNYGIPQFLTTIHQISAITHAHPRALIGCGIYSLFVRELLSTDNKEKAYETAIKTALEYYNTQPECKKELPHFIRILSQKIPSATESDIRSSGYVIDTLEASIWCFMRHSDTKSILLTAVNLGLDTDTTGTVAGGLAGIQYGLTGIPQEWLNSLARKNEIDYLVTRYIQRIESNIQS